MRPLQKATVISEMDRLAVAFSKPELDERTAHVYGERLSAGGVRDDEMVELVNRCMDECQRWPTVSAMLEKYRAFRLEKRDQGLMQIAGSPDHYERQRQALNKQLGLGEYRSGESRRRYGPEIEVTDPYLPPSLRKALEGGEPETNERGNGPRRMF